MTVRSTTSPARSWRPFADSEYAAGEPRSPSPPSSSRPARTSCVRPGAQVGGARGGADQSNGIHQGRRAAPERTRIGLRTRSYFNSGSAGSPRNGRRRTAVALCRACPRSPAPPTHRARAARLRRARRARSPRREGARPLDARGRRRAAAVAHGRAEAARRGPVSTAANGIGGESGSFRTPGWHRVHRRIGANAARHRVREPRAHGRGCGATQTRRRPILTRILTLEGLGDSINRGRAATRSSATCTCGTNHETRSARRSPHGCVRMAADVVSCSISWKGRSARGGRAGTGRDAGPALDARRFHYAGVGGSGMSALAQFRRCAAAARCGTTAASIAASAPEARGAQLERSASRSSRRTAAAPKATAPRSSCLHGGRGAGAGLRGREARGLPLVHRSEMLAHWVAESRSIAVSGTSGKSTVVAMTFEGAARRGRGPVGRHRRRAVAAAGRRAVGQRVGGRRSAGGRRPTRRRLARALPAGDRHGAQPVARPQDGVRGRGDVRDAAHAHALERFVCGEDRALGALRDGALVFASAIARGRAAATSSWAPTAARSPWTACASRCPCRARTTSRTRSPRSPRCRALGVDAARLVAPLAAFRGVARRFQSLGIARGVEVVDDFAHNPAKIRAALATARLRGCARARGLPAARLWPDALPARGFRRKRSRPNCARRTACGCSSVFYAGGTALRDFSSADLVRDMADRGAKAEFAPSANGSPRASRPKREGDLVLVMGARDPSLTAFAKDVLAALKG